MNSITRHFKFLSEQLQAKKDTLEKLVNLYEYVENYKLGDILNRKAKELGYKNQGEWSNNDINSWSDFLKNDPDASQALGWMEGQDAIDDLFDTSPKPYVSRPAPVASQSSAQAPVQAPTQQSAPAPTKSQSKPQRSYRQDDGTYVDENGNVVFAPPPSSIAQPPANEVPPLIAIGEPGSPGVEPLPVAPQPSFPQPQQPTYPTPTGQLPPQPKPQAQPQTPTGPSQADMDQFSGSRAKYYANLNKKAREAAEENLARIGTIDLSRQSASGRSQIAVNKLRAQRAAKADRFSQEDIDRMVASDTKERFMTPEEKAARAERTRAGAAALSAEAEKRYGPGGGVTTVDRRGDNKIQGTSMTFNQFRERYGREYNALNNDDANLVRGAASNFASGRVSPEAQQAAQTADAMNRGYAEQNAQRTQREGELDRAVDQSQMELDRYRNLTPEQRQAEVRSEVSRVQAQPGFVQGVAQDMATDLASRAKPTGGQVTQRASNMSAQPLTGRVSQAAPAAAPRQPLGSTVTPARPQPAPQPSANTGTVNTGGMNQPMDINDFDAEQQTGGPSERNRALPQPTATPFAQRPLRGRTVTRAARSFNTRGNATSRLA
jgi:hypothetical protein